MCRYKSFFALFLIVYIFFSPDNSTAETFKVGTWKTPQTIQPFFYKNFLPKGDKCQVFSFTNPADQKTALLAGSLDMCGTTIAHAIHSASLGQPVVLVASLCNKCSALVVRKESTIETIANLRGRKIGYVPGTMHEILLRETLRRNGLSPNADVKLTRVDFFDMGIALAKGGIDAFLSGEPFPTIATVKGYGRILSYPYYDKAIGTINAGMLVTRRFKEKNREAVYRLVKAHAAATRFLTQDRDGWLKKASTFGTSREILESAASNMELSWKMDEDFLIKAMNLGERMMELKVITRQPDYKKLFDMGFVERIQKDFN